MTSIDLIAQPELFPAKTKTALPSLEWERKALAAVEQALQPITEVAEHPVQKPKAPRKRRTKTEPAQQAA